MKFLLIALVPLILSAESIGEKKASFSEKSHARTNDAVYLNRELGNLKKSLHSAYSRAQKLADENADPAAFRSVLAEVE